MMQVAIVAVQMKLYFRYIKQYLPWLCVIFLTEGFTAILLWLADLKVFKALLPVLIFFTLLVFVSISYILIKKEKNKEKALKEFLLNPNKNREKLLLDAYGLENKESLLFLAKIIYRKQAEIEKSDLRLVDYEDYVELWAHEIKSPLSLLTLILDNQAASLSPEFSFKLDCIRTQIQSYISQILFYHRIKSEKKDYFFESLNVESCINSCLEDYAPLIHEKKIKVTLQNLNHSIFTDRRGFEFMIGQIIANSIKYSSGDPRLDISVVVVKGKTKLLIKDNGQGVKECDLPYIFEKGFTGDSGDVRKKSTGMGLYLVKQLADDLRIEIEASSHWNSGFTLAFLFPL